MADEFSRIARIARVHLGHSNAEIGIGDDAAVLVLDGRVVVTVDAAVEGVHFLREWLSPEDIGYRSTVAAASDVLAMAGTPRAAVAAWTLPEGIDDETIEAIARGQREACVALGMAVVGGNLSSGPVLSITTTVLGTIGMGDQPVRRDGARPGDIIAVAGALGDAAVGLAALRAGQRSGRAIDVWRRPPVLNHVSLSGAHAAIDVSDGLAQDLQHMAAASGVAIVIDGARISPDLEPLARSLGLDPVETALAGGEDYALVGAFAHVPPGFVAIGRVEVGRGVSPAPRGYRHR